MHASHGTATDIIEVFSLDCQSSSERLQTRLSQTQIETHSLLTLV